MSEFVSVREQLEGIRRMEEWFYQDELKASVETYRHLHKTIQEFEENVLEKSRDDAIIGRS